MSVNTAHAGGGVLIHAGETILLFSDQVQMEFTGQDSQIFKGTKHGRVYLTSHRVIFNSKSANDQLQSISAPFISMRDVELEQPVFGANYIKGIIRGQQNGGLIGDVKFKIIFKSGGCIYFGRALLRAAMLAQRNANGINPPPYSPPGGSWYEAPPPAYTPNPDQYQWLPMNVAYFGQPTAVFINDAPPPYPGVNVSGPGFVSNGVQSTPGTQSQNYGLSDAGSSVPNLPQGSFEYNSPSAPIQGEQEAASTAFFDPRNPPPFSERLNDLESQILMNNKKTQ